MINLNHNETLNLSKYPCGTYQNIEVKLGRKTYLVDITKNCDRVHLEFYRKLSNDRHGYSKYDPEANHVSVSVKLEACLDRRFFEHIEEIEHAQNIVGVYKRVLA